MCIAVWEAHQAQSISWSVREVQSILGKSEFIITTKYAFTRTLGRDCRVSAVIHDGEWAYSWVCCVRVFHIRNIVERRTVHFAWYHALRKSSSDIQLFLPASSIAKYLVAIVWISLRWSNFLSLIMRLRMWAPWEWIDGNLGMMLTRISRMLRNSMYPPLSSWVRIALVKRTCQLYEMIL